MNGIFLSLAESSKINHAVILQEAREQGMPRLKTVKSIKLPKVAGTTPRMPTWKTGGKFTSPSGKIMVVLPPKDAEGKYCAEIVHDTGLRAKRA